MLDGHEVAAHVAPYAARDGRIFGPIAPYLTRVADRLWFEGDVLVVERGARILRLRLAPRDPGALDSAYVALGPALRVLGARVTFRHDARILTIITRSTDEIASPQPFDPSAVQVAPRVIFTPIPVATPRPTWIGPSHPRRTPLPFPPDP